MALLAVRSLSKVYETGDVRVEALCDVCLEVQRGEWIAVMGASGSGKSTFLNILGCLDRPTRGSYRLDGAEVSELGSDALATLRNRTLGFVFQRFELLPRTSALENVELPLFYGDLPFREQRERARRALETVGLAGREQHVPTQLSGGQQQRVAIARAIVNRPRILLADEPTGNLDSATSHEILALFARLRAEEGITIVMVTHEADVAAWSDRVVTFRDGRVISDVRRERGAA